MLFAKKDKMDLSDVIARDLGKAISDVSKEGIESYDMVNSIGCAVTYILGQVADEMSKKSGNPSKEILFASWAKMLAADIQMMGNKSEQAMSVFDGKDPAAEIEAAKAAAKAANTSEAGNA